MLSLRPKTLSLGAKADDGGSENEIDDTENDNGSS